MKKQQRFLADFNLSVNEKDKDVQEKSVGVQDLKNGDESVCESRTDEHQEDINYSTWKTGSRGQKAAISRL